MLKYSDNKAGLGGVDKNRIQQLIDENTSDSFGAFAKKKEERIGKQQKEIKESIEKLTESKKVMSEEKMAALCCDLESSRDLSRTCVHIDMDAFFAAVEMRDVPRLRSIPMAVGNTAMLSTSNYIARQFGVRAAMPGFIAKKLCPNLELVSGNYDKYARESKVFSAIFAEYDPDMSMGSLDEAYVDLTEYLEALSSSTCLSRVRFSGDCICRLPLAQGTDPPGLTCVQETVEICPKCAKTRIVMKDEVQFGTSRGEIVRQICFRVEQATGLTCSAGIASNFMLAKICSDRNKPNGQYELPNELDAIVQFLKELPIRKVCGVGRVLEAQLEAVGIKMCSDIIRHRALLPHVFTSLTVESLLRYGLGLGSSHSWNDGGPRKSISVERSFSPSSDPHILNSFLKELCVMLSQQVSSISSAGGLSLKIKLSSFDVLTRSAHVPLGSNLLDVEVMHKHALPVLQKLLKEGAEIRLLGVRLYKLALGKMKQSESVLEMLRMNRKKEDEVSIGKEDCMENDVKGEEESVVCPVCEKKIHSLDETIINQHIDECLNRQTVSQILSQEQQNAPPAPKKQRTLDSFLRKS